MICLFVYANIVFLGIFDNMPTLKLELQQKKKQFPNAGLINFVGFVGGLARRAKKKKKKKKKM